MRFGIDVTFQPMYGDGPGNCFEGMTRARS